MTRARTERGYFGHLRCSKRCRPPHTQIAVELEQFVILTRMTFDNRPGELGWDQMGSAASLCRSALKRWGVFRFWAPGGPAGAACTTEWIPELAPRQLPTEGWI
jgi:hypothetical protein